MTDTDPGPLTALAVRYLREYLGAAPATAPAEPELRDVLPARGGAKPGAVQFWPASEDSGHLVGFVRIEMPNDMTTYSVSEGPTSKGRVFLFQKCAGRGTDRRRESYCVTCVDGAAVLCECSGWLYSHGCKHARTAEVLLANAWV